MFYLQRRNRRPPRVGLMFLSRGRLVYHTQDYSSRDSSRSGSFWSAGWRGARLSFRTAQSREVHGEFLPVARRLRSERRCYDALPVGADRWQNNSAAGSASDGPVRFILHHGAIPLDAVTGFSTRHSLRPDGAVPLWRRRQRRFGKNSGSRRGFHEPGSSSAIVVFGSGRATEAADATASVCRRWHW